MARCTLIPIVNISKERVENDLSYSRVNGDTTLNDAKMAEIKERKSM